LTITRDTRFEKWMFYFNFSPFWARLRSGSDREIPVLMLPSEANKKRAAVATLGAERAQAAAGFCRAVAPVIGFA